MPTVFIFFGLRFMFYSNDHELVHIHVVKGKGKIKEYAIYQVIPETLLLENNGLKPNELKMAEMIIEENREIIVSNWNSFFGKNIQQ
jgi:hypothetical protein